MLQNFIKIAFRNLRRKAGHSFINITGLSIGMAVAMLIGLWIYDELTYNRYHKNHDRIARVMQHTTANGVVYTGKSQPVPLYKILQQQYNTSFKHVVISTYTGEIIISNGNQLFYQQGNYMDPSALEMLDLRMIAGSQNALNQPNVIVISKSLAIKLFGNEDAINKVITINKQTPVTVTGVYEDIPRNSDFHNLTFIAPWDLFVASNDWMKYELDAWGSDVAHLYVQLQDKQDINSVSQKISGLMLEHAKSESSTLSLHPMNKWHLYETFSNGKNTGGRIQFVWLFGVIGISVLLLACINFMNLSTARSEKRTREVGIRKAIGSLRSQLIYQFYSETFFVVLLSFIISLVMIFFSLPWFNNIAEKAIQMPWVNLYFWLFSLIFIFITGLLAGSYPAIFLSSFEVIKALKGKFRTGAMAAVPRYVLVVVQFTFSVILIIGTIVVYYQVEYSKGRPAGYNQDGLLSVSMKTPDIHEHFQVLRNKLINNGTIEEMAEASVPVSTYGVNLTGFDWKGKDPGFNDNFGTIWVSPEYGNAIGWKLLEGRDFLRERITDDAALVVNKAAAAYMGLQNPVGEILRRDGKDWTIIGVVDDVVSESPYERVRPSIYMLSSDAYSAAIFRLNPTINTHTAIENIRTAFNEYAPGIPFDYRFADQEYAVKFTNEVRIGTLSGTFTVLALLISCLGLFGLASFVAEQRTKEIGVRKILGASAFNLWRMLSKEFFILVAISFLIAAPVAYYLMNTWLQDYTYRVELSWWIFAVSGLGSLMITLLTVSFQSVKAALANPVKSLRSE